MKKVISNNKFIILSLCVFSFGIIVFTHINNLYVNYKNKERVFCTDQDEIYQTIKIKFNDWLKYFPNPIPVLPVHVPSGDTYTIDATLWNKSDDPPILFVVTDRGWQEKFGNKGYFFTPSPNDVFIDKRYQFKYLSDNIYCYILQPEP